MATENFTCDQVFHTAFLIEHNASEFYKAAAVKADPGEIKELFLSLSTMEIEHEKTFKALRKDLPEELKNQTLSSKSNELQSLLLVGKEMYGYEGKKNPQDTFEGIERKYELLQYALRAEQDTVNLYNMLKEFSISAPQKEAIDKIIDEENKHITTIEELLNN